MDELKTLENRPLLFSLLNNMNIIQKSVRKSKTLYINKRLPKIVLPSGKLKMFSEWWNTDIRFESHIPRIINEGYLVLSDLQKDTVKVDNEFIKRIARAYHRTYREIENAYKEFRELCQEMTIYFKFVTDTKLYLEIYDFQNSLMTEVSFETGQESAYEEIIDLKEEFETASEFFNQWGLYCSKILATCFWYISVSSNRTKYIYTQSKPSYVEREKTVVKVKDKRIINTPIYDFTKVRTVKVENLVHRKKGWVYSHSFQVCGHYRHYKDGKTIFIKPFIKGKDKEFKNQTIVINPQTIK